MLDYESHLNTAIVEEVLAEYEWPVPWEVEDDLPDGILVHFPASGFALSDDYVGDVHLSFLEQHTGAGGVGIPEAMLVLVPEPERPPGPLTPGLISDPSTSPSASKTRNELRDLFTILLTHFRPTLLGDFSWAETYRDRG
ncbi:MAG: hypothetical protein K0V04_41225 [Deltaproteobacteria bacterium]|nr:hypothetical protein [Deltaproteobacteria bacterium]